MSGLSKPGVDRRRERTRAALLGAFSRLLLQRGYEGVTVAAVAEAANVGRSTLYEHFAGKDDLLGQSLTGPFGNLAATVEVGRAAGEFVEMLTHFREQREFGRVLFAGATRQVVTRRLAELIEQRAVLDGVREDGAELPLAVVAFQLAGSHLALIEAWIWGGLACGVETVARALVANARVSLRPMHP
jgi:AcrR family transcriptional regulator